MNNISRDNTQSPTEPMANFPSVLRSDGIVRDETTHHPAGSLACELAAKDHDFSSRPSSSQAQQNTHVFAMQSEDFPALPGSQAHLFSESDPTEAHECAPKSKIFLCSALRQVHCTAQLHPKHMTMLHPQT
jgi:hypothetical protein